jgi:hypothetical protein
MLPVVPPSLAPFNLAGSHLPAGQFRELFASHLRDAALTGTPGQETEKLRANISAWYEDFEQRLTGRYKRQLRRPLFFIGLALSVAFNLNTLRIITYLQAHPNDRQQAVALATQFVRAHPNGVAPGIPVPDPGKGKPDSTARRLRALQTYVDTLTVRLQGNGLPIGWWIKTPPVTDSSDAKALPDNFYIPMPGGVVDQVPTQAYDALAGVDSARLGMHRSAILLLKNFPAQPVGIQLKSTVDYTKLAAARSAVQKALNALEYVSRFYKPASAADANTVTNAIKDYRNLIRILEQVKPVRWSYAPYYLLYQRISSASSESLPNRRGSVKMTNQVWVKTAYSINAAELQQYELRDGKPEFTWRAAGSLWSVILLGWPLTALALMLGAPFWFDILSRFVNIRNVGLKPMRAS